MAGARLKHKTWVLIADGEKALFLRNVGDATYPNLEVVRLMHEANPPSREQGTDRPGRYNDVGAGGAHRSSVEETDWHRLSKERFADEIAERLYRMAHRGDFDEIILTAPPLVLGEIRKKLHKEVEDRVVGELAKTLTGHPIPEIERILTAD